MQLWRWMYYRLPLLEDIRDTVGLQGGFSLGFCEKFEAVASLDGGITLTSCITSDDGTRKLGLRLTAGPAASGQVECVLIPKPDRNNHVTVCVSSQLGCAMKCKFCFTGRLGWHGNLTPAQIVQQVVLAHRLYHGEDSADHRAARGGPHVTPVKNVVFMGMGEPLANLESVLAAVHILTHTMGLDFAATRVCVSTVGLIPEMRRFWKESSSALAVSLHATTDELRDRLMPVNRRYNLEELAATLRELFPADHGHPNWAGRFVLVQYVLLAGVNDSAADAARLAALLTGVRAKINLLEYNPHPGAAFARSGEDTAATFSAVLRSLGRIATIRRSRGGDRAAACGQLGVSIGRPEASPTAHMHR